MIGYLRPPDVTFHVDLSKLVNKINIIGHMRLSIFGTFDKRLKKRPKIKRLPFVDSTYLYSTNLE